MQMLKYCCNKNRMKKEEEVSYSVSQKVEDEEIEDLKKAQWYLNKLIEISTLD